MILTRCSSQEHQSLSIDAEGGTFTGMKCNKRHTQHAEMCFIAGVSATGAKKKKGHDAATRTKKAKLA